MAEKPQIPPPFITIPTPQRMPRGRGLSSTNPYGEVIRQRISATDRVLIETELAELNKHLAEGEKELELSGFLRWCSVYVARALQKARTGEAPDVDA